MKARHLMAATVAGLLSLPLAGPGYAQESVEGSWTGAILVLGGELGMSVHFTRSDSALIATMDIPQQGAAKLALRNVRVEPPKVHFELLGGPGLAVFDGELQGDSISGSFEQSGVNGTFWLRPAAAAAAELEPAAPPPYREEEVGFANGDVTLAGTLTVPEGPGPHPAVVLITGSGPQNRDEEIFGFKPFRLIADHLTRNGIAVLRYDDRGVGGSSGSVQTATSDDFANDALAAVALLQARPDIGRDAVGLLGHSEGALVAPIASGRSKDVAFLVLLAGTAVPGDRILLAQGQLILKANGGTPEQLERQRRLQEEIFAAIRADTGWEAVRHEIETQIRESIDALPPEQRDRISDLDTFVQTRAQQQILGVQSPWFRFFLDFDPVAALRRVTVPVLAVFGETDLQVPPTLNVGPMNDALAAAGNRDYTVRVLPGMNHLFQASETGNPSEYASLKKEFAPGFLELLSNWIQERTASIR